MQANTLKERLDAIHDRIAAAASTSGREVADVHLIAVSKTFPEEAIVAASALGQRAFGENKVQELVRKTNALGRGTEANPLEWHLIGHLQRNKAKDIVGRVDLLHALDSHRLGQELQKRLAAADSYLDCLIQVNVSGEYSKFGIDPAALDAFVDTLSDYDRLRIRGLMTLASPAEDPEQVRPEMAHLRCLSEGIADRCTGQQPLLSMGMSGDFEVAISEGATHVRIGSAIFGSR